MRKSAYSLLLLLGFLSCQSPETTDSPTPPNIILILTDDQGWGDLSISGNTNLSTPNIDQLATNGALFDRFYVSPVCSPTRAEILTGRYAVRGGVYSTGGGGERLDLDEITFAKVFQQAGYATAAYGKWHSGMQYPYHPNGRGFEDYYGFCSGHWGNYFDPLLERNGELTTGKGFLPDDLTNQGIEFIELNKDQPFLLYLPYNTPHSPMQVPDKWWDKFKDGEIAMDHRYREKEDLEKTKAAYAMCENIDWNVGRVHSKVKELGLEENTIIIYLSDNGPNGARWNENMRGQKGSTDEGGVRSPLIMHWKGKIMAGTKIPQIASSLDLFPTLTELTGITFKPSKPLDGKSLKPLLLSENVAWEDRLLVNHWRGRTSIRSQEYRLDHENKLYQMLDDPGQSTDISEQHPAIRQELIQAKEQWEKDVLIELPEADTRTFPLGHPDFVNTQIPARDGVAHGNIKRSNRWPNCSFFTNWTSTEDKITWEVEVVEDGAFEVVLYYTCAAENVGTNLKLSFGDRQIEQKITEAHNPPLKGMEHDRIERGESYVKDFKPLNMGVINLAKGQGTLTLQATDIPGAAAIDFRLMMLKRKI